MKARSKNYNRRKIQVLRLAQTLKGKLTIKDVKFNLGVTYLNARQLLFHYRQLKLFSHPRRGIYRLSKRGRDRLEYLENRLRISKFTNIDIGLNHHRPPPIPLSELAQRYMNATGQPIPAIHL